MRKKDLRVCIEDFQWVKRNKDEEDELRNNSCPGHERCRESWMVEFCKRKFARLKISDWSFFDWFEIETWFPIETEPQNWKMGGVDVSSDNKLTCILEFCRIVMSVFIII